MRWQVGGTDALRALCASWHGAQASNALVTVGAAEANFITVTSLLRPGEHFENTKTFPAASKKWCDDVKSVSQFNIQSLPLALLASIHAESSPFFNFEGLWLSAILPWRWPALKHLLADVAADMAADVAAGDHVVVMEPGYRQVRGCAINLGASVSAFPLDPASGWRPDLKVLAAAVAPNTRLIAGDCPFRCCPLLDYCHQYRGSCSAIPDGSCVSSSKCHFPRSICKQACWLSAKLAESATA